MTAAPSWADRCAAVLVVFDTQRDPTVLLQRLQTRVGQLVVVDNAPGGHPSLRNRTPTDTVTVVTNRNCGGLAGAYNRALAWLDAHAAPHLAAVVFIDEDSDPDGLTALLACPDARAAFDAPHTAAIAPAYRELATGIRGQYLAPLKGWRLRFWPREFGDLRPVSFLINSMSCWKRSALARIGPFDESLGVDHVDTDYCLRARRLDLQLLVDGRHVFLHRLGQRQAYRFLGRTLQTGGHGAARRYQIARNTVWLIRRHGWRFPSFAVLGLTRLAYEALGIVMAESARRAKLAALLKGIGAGCWHRAPQLLERVPPHERD